MKLKNLIKEAIWIAKNGTTGEKVMGAFSGGKDSIAVRRICDMAGLKIDWHYHNTTIDPPEVVHFIRRYYPNTIFDKSKYGNFFIRAKQKNILPSFRIRWCCDEYKEYRGPLNTVIITGERREESMARSSQPVIGLHRRTRRVMVRPLANWTEEHVWEFIECEDLWYPSLYDEGFNRLGCVGCPLTSRKNREAQFKRWPKYEKKWKALAKHIYDTNAKRSAWRSFKTFEEYWDGWMNHKF